MTPLMRQRAFYVGVGAVTLITGLLVRFAPLGLPWFIVKYGGSTMWALMVYWSLAFILPGTTPRTLALTAALISTLVEFQRLYHTPALDSFRHSLPGILLLGNYFSLRDIAAYWLAITFGAFVDARWIRTAKIGYR
jgi:Protein of unknown function (DUF2809)